jgi:hypothetical protein
MKQFSGKFINLVSAILFFGIFSFCNQLVTERPVLEDIEVLTINESDNLSGSNLRLVNTGNCNQDCIFDKSNQYFENSATVSEKFKSGSKNLSYNIRQYQDSIIIKVNFRLTGATLSGNSSLKINIENFEKSVQIQGNETFLELSMLLPNTYTSCTPVAISIKQMGLGKSISIDEIYQLIPTCQPLTPEIGSIYQGGKVIYIFKEGDLGFVSGEVHGLIYSDYVLAEAPWGCNTDHISTSLAVGAGKSNTKAIIEACPGIITAAYLSSILEYKGFSDWYLPSFDEMQLVSFDIPFLPIFDYDNNKSYYWTSSQHDNVSAVGFGYYGLFYSMHFKNSNLHSLALRSF